MTDNLDEKLKERLRAEDINHHERQIAKLKAQRNAINLKIRREENALAALYDKRK